MNVTSVQVKKILTSDHKFSQLAFSMMITRLRAVYSRNPSPTTLQTCENEINAFLQSHSSIMGMDIVALSKL